MYILGFLGIKSVFYVYNRFFMYKIGFFWYIKSVFGQLKPVFSHVMGFFLSKIHFLCIKSIF